MKLSWADITSSNVSQIAHNGTNLYVKFKGSDTQKMYCYENVPSTAYKDFLMAESKGKHLTTHIKPKYTCSVILIDGTK